MNKKVSLRFNEKNNKTYDVKGIYKTGTELTYDDVKCLYEEFYNTYGKYPTVKFQTMKYNVPHNKILARVLDEQGVTLNDFQNHFGVVAHVRSDPKNYDAYVEKFKDLYRNNIITSEQNLYNNKYGLPNPNFFVKYCPDKSVDSFLSFIKWCGLKHCKIKEKEDIINVLIEYENKIGRPITKYDITVDNIGFSEIVITRLWGSFSKCKEELGLLETKMGVEIYSFEEYLNRIDLRLNEIISLKNRNVISWKDLESRIGYKSNPIDHHSVFRKFKEKNLDFGEYLVSKGFIFNPGSYGHSQMFSDGEKTKSNFEYDYSMFLREIGFKYNDGYVRDVMYKKFCRGLASNSKINCDYKVSYNNKDYYIEIAGILKSEADYSAEITNDINAAYRDKMILKKKILEDSNVNYLILYADDMNNDSYKSKTKEFLGIKKVESKSFSDM